MPAPLAADVAILVSNIVAAKDALLKSRSGSFSATPNTAHLTDIPSQKPVVSPVVSPSSGHLLLLPETEVTTSIVLTDLSGLPSRTTPSGPTTAAASCGQPGALMSAQELALYNAAAKLCEALGGVDYRSVAITSNRALEAIVRMLKAEFELAGKADIVPTSLVAKQAYTFRALIDESRRLLAASGYPVPPLLPPALVIPQHLSTAQHLGAVHSSNSSATSGQRLSLTNQQPRVRNVSIDVPGVPAAVSTPRRGSGKTAQEPAASEAYDLRLMHGAFGEQAGSIGAENNNASNNSSSRSTRDLEDEITMLRSKVERLQCEKKTLAAVNEKNAALVLQLKNKLGQDLDTIQSLQSQMEGEIRLLAIHTGNGSLVGSSSATACGAADGSSSSAKKAAATATADAILTKMSVNLGSSGADDGFGLETPPPTTGDRPAVLHPQQPTPQPSPHHAHPPSVRFERIESLYYDVYRGKGMDMLWNTLHCVFKSEFDTQPASAPSPPREGHGPASSTPRGKDDEVNVADPGHLLAYNIFKAQFYDHVVGKLSTYNTFLESLVQITPLRSDYIANCLKAKVKPNSGVVKLLSTITSDRDAIDLNLSSNYLGDGGLAPLVPLFNRLYRLQSLKLSDIGIKNSGAQQLASALMNHPSLVSLDVSKNGISRSGGKELLALASSLPSLRQIDISGTSIDAALQERIITRVSLNGTATSPQKTA
jgi:hypothetical protein